MEIARKIARNVRFSGGGLRNVKALGFELKDRGIAQVSMNLVNHEETPPHRVFELVKTEAERYGVPIIGSEIIGLAPLKAILDAVDFYLRLENYPDQQILDLKVLEAVSKHPFTMKNSKISRLLDDVASSKPTPGAGSVAALNGAIAAATLEKIIRITANKEPDDEKCLTLKNLINSIKHLRMELVRLMDEDATAFREFMIQQKTQKHLTRQEEPQETKLISKNVERIIQIPLNVARACHELLRLTKDSIPLINEMMLMEALAATTNAHSGAKIAISLSRANLIFTKDLDQISRINEELLELEKEVDSSFSVLLSTFQKHHLKQP